jgi:hypothetical protein
MAAGRELDGLERETSDELALRYGRQHRSRGAGIRLLAPWDARVRLERRALDTTAGAGGVPTILDPTIVDILRAHTYFGLLGGRIIPDCRGGKFGIVRRTATATVSWVAEGSPPGAESHQTLAQAVFDPKTAAGSSGLPIPTRPLPVASGAVSPTWLSSGRRRFGPDWRPARSIRTAWPGSSSGSDRGGPILASASMVCLLPLKSSRITVMCRRSLSSVLVR